VRSIEKIVLTLPIVFPHEGQFSKSTIIITDNTRDKLISNDQVNNLKVLTKQLDHNTNCLRSSVKQPWKQDISMPFDWRCKDRYAK